jgi:hypothetical protein
MFSIIVKSVIELLTDGCDLLLYNPLNLEPLQELLADEKSQSDYWYQTIDIRLLIESVDHQF